MDRPSVNTPVRKLSATELATVRIALTEPPRYVFSEDLCVILAVGLHYRAQWPREHIRSDEWGWPLAEHCAAWMSEGNRPLDVWVGWDALRMLDEHDDLGVQVWLSADTSLMASSRIRLRDRLMQIDA